MAGGEMGVLWSMVGRLDVGMGGEGAGNVGWECEPQASCIGPFDKLRAGPSREERAQDDKKNLGEGGDGAFGADEDCAAGGVGADGVEFDGGFFRRADAGGVFGRAEIEKEFR